MTFVNGLTINVVINYGNNIVWRSHKFLMDWKNKKAIQDLYFQIDEKVEVYCVDNRKCTQGWVHLGFAYKLYD